MNLQKSIQIGLAEKGYKTRKAFCEANHINPGLLSRLTKGKDDSGTNLESSIYAIKQVANGFGVPVSEFIAWGE